MTPYQSPKSDRRVILLFLGILGLTSLILLPFRQRPYSTQHQRELQHAALQDSYAQLRLQREQARQEREAAYQHRKDSFAQLKVQREQARREREAAYQHRKDSFAQLRAQREAARQRYKDSLQALRPVKLQTGQTIDINQADSAQLVQVPGIGAVRARMIQRYREQLGGFYSPNQVLEITDMPASVLPYLTVSQPLTPPLHINQATLPQLVRHPYLNYQQAKAVMDYRRKYGAIKDLQQLSLLDEFTPHDVERLSHYLQP